MSLEKRIITHYLVDTLIASIHQSISKCKPSLCISVVYLKKHIYINI